MLSSMHYSLHLSSFTVTWEWGCAAAKVHVLCYLHKKNTFLNSVQSRQSPIISHYFLQLMTAEQVMAEKHSIQKSLLQFEKKYGRPVSKHCVHNIQQIAKVFQQASWTVENHNWFTTYESFLPQHALPLGSNRFWFSTVQLACCKTFATCYIHSIVIYSYMYIWARCI